MCQLLALSLLNLIKNVPIVFGVKTELFVITFSPSVSTYPQPNAIGDYPNPFRIIAHLYPYSFQYCAAFDVEHSNVLK